MPTGNAGSGGPVAGAHTGGAGAGHIGGGDLSVKFRRIAREFKNLSDLFNELASTPMGAPVPSEPVPSKKKKKKKS